MYIRKLFSFELIDLNLLTVSFIIFALNCIKQLIDKQPIVD